MCLAFILCLLVIVRAKEQCKCQKQNVVLVQHLLCWYNVPVCHPACRLETAMQR